MTLSDKVRMIIETHGSLSSEMVKHYLERDFKINKSRRQVQRMIKELVEENVIVPNATFGRSQTYSISRDVPSAISNLFLGRFWEELFEIREDLIKKRESKDPLTDDPLADFFDTFRKLRSLVKMLPKDVQVKIKIKMEKMIELTDNDKKMIEEGVGTLPILLAGGVPYSEKEWERRQRRDLIISNILKERLEDIVGEVATLLHEKLRKEALKHEIK